MCVARITPDAISSSLPPKHSKSLPSLSALVGFQGVRVCCFREAARGDIGPIRVDVRVLAAKCAGWSLYGAVEVQFSQGPRKGLAESAMEFRALASYRVAARSPS